MSWESTCSYIISDTFPVCIIIHTSNKLFKEGMEVQYFSEPIAFFLYFSNKDLKAISLAERNMQLGENC